MEEESGGKGTVNEQDASSAGKQAGRESWWRERIMVNNGRYKEVMRCRGKEAAPHLLRSAE